MLIASNVQSPLDATVDESARGTWREAHSELERFPAERQGMPGVLVLRCRACAQEERWAEIEIIASSGVVTYPHEPYLHTQLAWAIYRQGRTPEAYAIAARAAERFPQSVAVAYTLACLNGALKRIPEARRWLDSAIERARNPDKVKLRSLVQPELQCLWNDAPSPTGQGESPARLP